MSLYPSTFLKNSLARPSSIGAYYGIPITLDELAKLSFLPCSINFSQTFYGLIAARTGSPTALAATGLALPTDFYWRGTAYVPDGGYAGAPNTTGASATSQSFRISNPPTDTMGEYLLYADSGFGTSGVNGLKVGNFEFFLDFYMNQPTIWLRCEFSGFITSSSKLFDIEIPHSDGAGIPIIIPLTLFGREIDIPAVLFSSSNDTSSINTITITHP